MQPSALIIQDAGVSDARHTDHLVLGYQGGRTPTLTIRGAGSVAWGQGGLLAARAVVQSSHCTCWTCGKWLMFVLTLVG
jgi:hypothetical protein